MSHTITLLALALMCTLTSVHVAANNQPLTVAVAQGTVMGKIDTEFVDVRTFLGIPYAAPPIGPLRWKSTVPASNFTTNPYNATVYGSICTQLDNGIAGSENCLFLNVFTPLVIPFNTSLPVSIFIHGGGWIEGSSNAHPGNHLVHANGGMVMVTINYRLGPFGFLAHPALSAETGPGQIASSGNYGFEDQREAMKWVQKNIHAFGGDPTRVTIGGESAGAVSTCLHLVSNASAGLFNQAIIESGGCDNAKSLNDYEDVGKAFVAQLSTYNAPDCNSTNLALVSACLRSSAVTPARLFATALQQKSFNIFGPTGMSPNVDGKNLVDFPPNIWNAGKMNQPMKLLVGTNQQEMATFIPPIGSQLPEASPTVIQQYSRFLSGNNSTIVEYYTNGVAEGRFASDYLDYVSLLSKTFFQCPVLRVAKWYEKLNAVGNGGGSQAEPSVYTYSYNYTYSFAPWNTSVPNGAIHGAELVPVFGFVDNGTALDQLASQQMMQYWIKFIQYGGNVNTKVNLTYFSPNIASPTWTGFSPDTMNAMIFQYDGSVYMQNNIYQPECAMWDSVGILRDITPYVPRINPTSTSSSSSSSGPFSYLSSSSSSSSPASSSSAVTSSSSSAASSSSSSTADVSSSSAASSSSTADSSTSLLSSSSTGSDSSSSSSSADSPSTNLSSSSTSSGVNSSSSSSSSSSGEQINQSSSSSTGGDINASESFSSSVSSLIILFVSILLLSHF